jgi:hypothetical protein
VADRVWDARIDTLDGGRVRRIRIEHDGKAVPYAEVLELWQGDDSFRALFTTLLADAPYRAYLWETPPITRSTVTRGFEFVLVESPTLAGMTPDPEAFAGPFEAAGTGADVAAFANLGGDALLVAPCPQTPDDTYPHLAAFVRTAPMAQRQAFWRAVGAAVSDRLSDCPLWLSTNGLGVAWLHVRLDSRPKYYVFEAYRRSS